VRGHLVAVGAVVVIAVLRVAAGPLFEDRSIYLPFVLAVVIAASYGGRGPAATATFGSAIATAWIATQGAAPDDDLVANGFGLAVFLVVAAVVTLLATQLVADRERARTSERRTMQLQSVSNAVARGMPAEDVARTVLREGLESLGAGAGVVAVVDEDGASIRVIASSGYSDERMAAFQRFAIDGDLPMAEAVRLREPIIIPTADELRSRYPRVADLIREDGSSVVLPLLFEEHAIGALYFRFRETRTFDADDRAYFLTLGRQCASAMVRARLAEAERAATVSLRSVTDNPVYVLPDDDRPLGTVVSNGGYHNARAPAAIDAVGVVWADLCQVAQRLTDKLLQHPTTAALLARDEWTMKPLHMVQTGWAEEARRHAGATLLSLGGFGQNDVPSMAFLAWRRTDAVGRCLDASLAVLAALGAQALHGAGRPAPPALAALVARLLAKRPADRVPHASDVVRALEQVDTRSQPVAPPSAAEPRSRFGRIIDAMLGERRRR